MPEDHRALYEAGTVADLAAELNSRGLSSKGDKPELVDRLLDHDAAQPRATGPASDDDEDAESPICGLCWPGGWPDGHEQAHCEHGEYTR